MLTFIKMMTCALIWFPCWLITYPLKRGRNNCLTWTLHKFNTEGGYIVLRWCRSNSIPFVRWPHFLWLPEKHGEHLQHVVPQQQEEGQRPHVLPRPWFNPEILQGDDENDKQEN